MSTSRLSLAWGSRGRAASPSAWSGAWSYSRSMLRGEGGDRGASRAAAHQAEAENQCAPEEYCRWRHRHGADGVGRDITGVVAAGAVGNADIRREIVTRGICDEALGGQGSTARERNVE